MQIGTSFSKGKVAYAHDVRLTKTKNINPNLTKNNIILVDKIATIEDKNLKTFEQKMEAYINKKLDYQIEAFNRGKKPSRQIKETHYMDWHKKQPSKKDKPLVHEFVLQYGEHDTLGKRYYEATDPQEKEQLRKEMITIYSKWLQNWQESFPHIHVVWATIHMDEDKGTPHMHIAFLGLGEGYKRGLPIQVSLSKALACDGYERAQSRENGFQLERAIKDFRHVQEHDLKALGYDIKNTNPDRRSHQPVELYKASKRLEKAVSDKTVALERLEAQIDREIDLHTRVVEKAAKAPKLFQRARDTVTVPSETWQSALDLQHLLKDLRQSRAYTPREVAEYEQKLKELLEVKEKAEQLIQEKAHRMATKQLEVKDHKIDKLQRQLADSDYGFKVLLDVLRDRGISPRWIEQHYPIRLDHVHDRSTRKQER